MPNSFGSLATFPVDGRTFRYYRLDALRDHGVDLDRLPFSLKILLENLLRNEDETTVTRDDILGLAELGPQGDPQPARSPSGPAGSCSRTSPASPPWSTSPRCATP